MITSSHFPLRRRFFAMELICCIWIPDVSSTVIGRYPKPSTDRDRSASSFSVNAPFRKAVALKSPSAINILSDRLTPDISSENITVGWPDIAAVRAMLSAKAVLPIAGRAAKMTSCPPFNPNRVLSNLSIPVKMPVFLPSERFSFRFSYIDILSFASTLKSAVFAPNVISLAIFSSILIPAYSVSSTSCVLSSAIAMILLPESISCLAIYKSLRYSEWFSKLVVSATSLVNLAI